MKISEFVLMERLFNALDDNTRYIYSQYKNGGEYPSELAIKALIDAEHSGLNLSSKALEEMNKELANDIVNQKYR